MSAGLKNRVMGWQGDLWRRSGKIHIYVKSRNKRTSPKISGWSVPGHRNRWRAVFTDKPVDELVMQVGQATSSQRQEETGSRNCVTGPGIGSSFQTPSPLL